MKQRILVCGGRDYVDRKTLFEVLNVEHSANTIILLIHGGASGADRLAGEWADVMGVPCAVYNADWVKHGRAAGPIRNLQMLNLECPHLVIAFPGGRGTADMVRQAIANGVPVRQSSTYFRADFGSLPTAR